MTRILSRRLLAGLLMGAALLFGPLPPTPSRRRAKQALIVDYETGSVLFDKNADEPVHPASMTKLMTLYILVRPAEAGKLKLDDTLPGVADRLGARRERRDRTCSCRSTRRCASRT